MTSPEAAKAASGSEAGETKVAPPRVHLDFLDGLRGLAALAVVLDHAWLQSYPWVLFQDSYPSRHLNAAAGWLIYAGNFAVTLFITLSGFCLMLPVLRSGQLRGGWKGFLLGRVRRILPPYYAALALSVLLGVFVLQAKTHTLYDSSLPVTRHGVLLHLVLLQNLSTADRAQINGPMWSVAVESQIYLLFPLLVLVWKRFGIGTVVALAGGLSLVGWFLVRGTYRDGLNPEYLFIFSLGMYAALLAFRDSAADPQPRNVSDGWLTGAGLGCVALLLLLVHRYGLVRMDVENLLVGLGTVCLLVVSTRRPQSGMRRLLSLKPVVWVGGFSYSLYLIHFPLQQVLWQYVVHPSGLSRQNQFLTIAFPGTVVLVFLSFGFYRLVEKPFMRSKAKA